MYLHRKKKKGRAKDENNPLKDWTNTFQFPDTSPLKTYILKSWSKMYNLSVLEKVYIVSEHFLANVTQNK